MQSITRRCIQLFMVLAAITCSLSAHAAYTFTIVKYPGADLTQLWGVNNSGQILGNAVYFAAPTQNFLYDPRAKTFTLLPSVPGGNTGLIGINDPGVIVGGRVNQDDVGNNITPEIGLILDTKNRFTTFSHPLPLENTEGRGVSNSGLVTGFAYDDTGASTIGFIYDPKHNTYTDFLESPATIAQGINSQGQVVGSVLLDPGVAYPGSPRGRYGFLRDANGTITEFQVNGIQTRARGINDSGQIAGFTNPGGAGAHSAGFVGTLAGFSFQTLNVPGATDTIAQAINNAGQIVGYTESDGFIATPIATGKDQCKGGGWQSLSRADGTFFKNQGDCIQYVNTGK